VRHAHLRLLHPQAALEGMCAVVVHEALHGATAPDLDAGPRARDGKCFPAFDVRILAVEDTFALVTMMLCSCGRTILLCTGPW